MDIIGLFRRNKSEEPVPSVLESDRKLDEDIEKHTEKLGNTINRYNEAIKTKRRKKFTPLKLDVILAKGVAEEENG